MDARRTSRSFATAILLHAGLFLLVARSARIEQPPARAPVPPPIAEEALVVVDVSEPIAVARRRAADDETHVGMRVEPRRVTAPRTGRPSSRAFAPPIAEPDVGEPNAKPAPVDGGEHEGWSIEDDGWGDFGEPAGPSSRPSSLTTALVRESVDEPTAAPTRAPRRRRVTAQQTNEAVRSLVRMADRELGLGAPQETKIAHAVQEAGRASGVPSGTAFAITLAIDASGAITSASIKGDDAGSSAWPHVLTAVRGALDGSPIPLGPDERTTGATVRVEARVLHVLPSGSEHAVTMGECPKMPLIGGEDAPSFFKFGGTPYLDPPNGLCVLGDAADVDALRTIVVRTTTTTTRPGDAPKPLSAYPKPKTKKLLPNPVEELIKFLNKPSKKPK